MSSDKLRQKLIQALKSDDVDVRKAAVTELAASDVSDKFRVLEQWSLREKNSSIKAEIDRILRNADWFYGAADQVKYEFTEEQSKVIKTLHSGDLNKVKNVFSYLVKNRRTEFLKTTLEIEKKFDDNFLKFCNIRLLYLLGSRSINYLKTYLDFPDHEVQRMAVQALAAMNNELAIETCLLKSCDLGPTITKLLDEKIPKWSSDKLLNVIGKFMEDSDSKIRLQAALWCSKISHKLSFEYCQVLIGDDDQEVVRAAWKAVERLSNDITEAQELLTQVGYQENYSKLVEERKRFHQVSSDGRNFLTLKKEFESGGDRLKASIIQKIGFLESSDESIISFLIECLQSEDDRQRANAVEAYSQLAIDLDPQILLDCLKDSNNRVVGNACLALYNFQADKYKNDIYSALERLANSSQEAPRLTLLFYVDQTRDEGLLPMIRKQIIQRQFDLVKERSTQLMEDWSAQRPNVLYEFEEWKRSFQIMLDSEEPLDEFID